MALNAIIDQTQYDGLGETMQQEYKAGSGDLDGHFTLDVTPSRGYGLDNVTSLKSALSSEREQVTTLKGSLAAFEGLNVGEARNALAKVKDMVNWTPEEEVQAKIDAQLSQLSDKHKTELKGVADELGLTTQQLQKAMIDQTALTALSKHKGSPVLLLPAIRNQTRLKKNENGSYKVEVVDGSGTVRISPAANSTGPMTVGELVAELKTLPDYAQAFEGSHSQGSGAPGSDEGGGRVDGKQLIISEEDARDPQKYRAAKAKALKDGKDLAVA